MRVARGVLRLCQPNKQQHVKLSPTIHNPSPYHALLVGWLIIHRDHLALFRLTNVHVIVTRDENEKSNPPWFESNCRVFVMSHRGRGRVGGDRE